MGTVISELRAEMKLTGITLMQVKKETESLMLGDEKKGYSYIYVKLVMSPNNHRHNDDIVSIAKALVQRAKQPLELAA